MGRIIDLEKAPAKPLGDGVTQATLVGDSRQLEASLLRLWGGGRYAGEVPAGADQYLYVISGRAVLDTAGAVPGIMGPRSFAIIEEGRSFALAAEDEAQVLSVVVPPPGGGAGLPGFHGGHRIARVDELPALDVPEQKKRRIFLATHDTVGSQRGHAMIVEYVADTVTPKHHHPNAESMFVLLDGNLRFLVNGEEHVLGPGKATHFPMNDSHSLRSADGKPLHFLEFHVPGQFTTQYDS